MENDLAQNNKGPPIVSDGPPKRLGPPIERRNWKTPPMIIRLKIFRSPITMGWAETMRVYTVRFSSISRFSRFISPILGSFSRFFGRILTRFQGFINRVSAMTDQILRH